MKKKEWAFYLLEGLYPYVIATIAVWCCIYFKFNITFDKGYNNVLGGIVTLDSIIIGFIGAVMPVILSMKNDSKFVRYVFENDKENLFCKYLKITLLLGIGNILITLVMYVITSIPKQGQIMIYYIWVFLTTAFLAATYRSMSYMITLIFSKDSDYYSKSNMNKSEQCEVSENRSNELRKKYEVK